MRRTPAFAALLVASLVALVACLTERDAPPPSSRPTPTESAVVREGSALSMTGALPLRARFDAERRAIVRRSDGAAIAFKGKRVEPTLRGARVEYASAGVVEWYERTPNGIEQGFTIAERGGSGLVVDVGL